MTWFARPTARSEKRAQRVLKPGRVGEIMPAARRFPPPWSVGEQSPVKLPELLQRRDMRDRSFMERQKQSYYP
jgi:hypothetical protein